jgi:hypothetical protein
MPGPRWRLAALLALVVATGGVRAQGPGLRTFRDWALGCDEARHCTALGLSPDQSSAIGFVHLERSPGPSALLQAGVGWWNGETRGHGPVTLVMGGTHADTLASGVTPPGRDDDYRLIALDSAQTRRLVDAARRVTAVMILSASGDTLGVVSLLGFRATLLAMDDAQRRTGTVTALDRRGPRATATVPPAPRVRPIQVRPYTGTEDQRADTLLALAARKHLGPRMGSDCDDPDEFTWDEATPLDATRHLVGLMCFRGAYNVSFRWYILTDRNVRTARAATFVESPASRLQTPDVDLVNATFDPAAGTMRAFAKGRGLGDCGVLSAWAWDGSRFVLTERRELHECRGVTSDWWPVTARRPVVR